MKRTILVKCTLIVPVSVPDDADYDATFDIEENHCPGTGLVGTAIDKVRKVCNQAGTCWACVFKGKNQIVEPVIWHQD